MSSITSSHDSFNDYSYSLIPADITNCGSRVTERENKYPRPQNRTLLRKRSRDQSPIAIPSSTIIAIGLISTDANAMAALDLALVEGDEVEVVGLAHSMSARKILISKRKKRTKISG